MSSGYFCVWKRHEFVLVTFVFLLVIKQVPGISTPHPKNTSQETHLNNNTISVSRVVDVDILKSKQLVQKSNSGTSKLPF